MSKSADAFRTISEVAEWLDTPAHVLRFWESKFSQIKPVKRAGGRRYYRPADMLLVGGIKKLLHDDGLTIKGLQKLLREKGVKHVALMSIPLDEETDALAGEAAAADTAASADAGVAIDSGTPDLENVEIDVPLAPEDPEANVLQFQRDEPATAPVETVLPAATASEPELTSEAPPELAPASDGDMAAEPEITAPVAPQETSEADTGPNTVPAAGLPQDLGENMAQSTAPEAPVPPVTPSELSPSEPELPQETQQPDVSETTPEAADPIVESQASTDTPSEALAESPAEPETGFATEFSTEPESAAEPEPALPFRHRSSAAPAAPTSEPVEDAEQIPAVDFEPESQPGLVPDARSLGQDDAPLATDEDVPQATPPEPERASVPEHEPELEAQSEPEAPPQPQPTQVNVPADLSDSGPDTPPAPGLLAAISHKTDRLSVAQIAEVAPLLERLEALTTKMQAQSKE